MAKHRWNYSGDIDLREGGFFWREDDATDYVCAVRITPCSDAGGPHNLFHVEQGSIYLPIDPDARKRALSTCGYEHEENVKRWMLVESFLAYHRIDRDARNGEIVIRIGKPENDARNWNPEPGTILRGNASLERYIKREILD